MAAASHSETSPIFAFSKSATRGFPPLICSHYSQPGTREYVLHLFDALILVVLSVLPYNSWLQPHIQKHPQFSRFQNPQQEDFPHWYALTTVNQAQGSAYRTYLMCRFSPCHSFGHPIAGCGPESRNISNFRIFQILQHCCPPLFDIPHYSQPAFDIVSWTYLMRWISSCRPFSDPITGCGSVDKNVSKFRIPASCGQPGQPTTTTNQAGQVGLPTRTVNQDG